MTDVRRALSIAAAQFAGSPTPRLDAELLLAEALERPRTWLHAWPEAELDGATMGRLEELVARRAVGEPIAYLLGRREFWSLELEVGPDVLIPRPETEGLVEAVLTHLKEARIERPRILDLGTGSGCIALALARERLEDAVTAVDAAPGALAVARRNIERKAARNVELLEGRWFEPVAGRVFDAIVSNPPYVRGDDPHLDQGDVRFEPRAALEGGPDGLDAIRALAAGAPAHLAPGGLLALEHGADQARDVLALLGEQGLLELGVRPDAAGLARVALGRKGWGA
jgi:release factor glutamine methyltransferase